jgi:hypothetical protein
MAKSTLTIVQTWRRDFSQQRTNRESRVFHAAPDLVSIGLPSSFIFCFDVRWVVFFQPAKTNTVDHHEIASLLVRSTVNYFRPSAVHSLSLLQPTQQNNATHTNTANISTSASLPLFRLTLAHDFILSTYCYWSIHSLCLSCPFLKLL